MNARKLGTFASKKLALGVCACVLGIGCSVPAFAQDWTKLDTGVQPKNVDQGFNNPGSGGGGGAVSQIIAGLNVTISPVGGTGNVTINATGGGSTTPGGISGQIQFNNGGAFGGETLVPLANGGTNSATAPTSGQVGIGNAGGTAYVPQTVGGDGVLNNVGGLTVTKTNGVALAASATSDTTQAGNITGGTLAVGRLPTVDTAHGGTNSTTAPTSGQVNVGNAGGTASVPQTLGGDVASVSALGAVVVSKTNGVAFAASATSDTTQAGNITGGTLPAGRMPALTGDVTSSAGAVATTIANSAVTNAKSANMVAHTYKGNNTGSTAAPADITSTQLTADLNAFTSSLQGMVPASGGGTTNFLRADGAFAAPPGGGGGSATIGGDGSEGAGTPTGTETTATQHNYTTCALSGGYTVKSGTVLNTTGAFSTGANTLTVSTDAPGGDSNANNLDVRGVGLGAGCGNSSGGGGGGGCGGNGGTGTNPNNSTAGGGQKYPLARGIEGSGGGGTDSQAAANGGGSLVVCNSATGITISSGGAVNAVGASVTGNATNGFHGAGAGSGGVEGFYSTVSTTITGAVSVAGGSTGNLTGTTTKSGGAGGGGYVLRHSPSNTGAGTITVSGGSAGTATTLAGQPGASGVSLTITGTPNYPLLTEHRRQINEMVASGWMENGHHGAGHEAPMFATARAQAMCFGDGEHWSTTQHEHATQLAAWNAKDANEFAGLCFNFENGEQIDGAGKVCQIYIGDETELNAA